MASTILALASLAITATAVPSNMFQSNLTTMVLRAVKSMVSKASRNLENSSSPGEADLLPVAPSVAYLPTSSAICLKTEDKCEKKSDKIHCFYLRHGEVLMVVAAMFWSRRTVPPRRPVLVAVVS